MRNIKVLKNNEGYEGLYVDSKLVEEAQPLNEGIERVIYFLHLSKKYETPLEDFVFEETDAEELPSALGETNV